MLYSGQESQASGRRSPQARMDNLDVSQKTQPSQQPLWQREGFDSEAEFEQFMVRNNERLQGHMYHVVQARAQVQPQSQLQPELQPQLLTSTTPPRTLEGSSTIQRKPSKAKRAFNNFYGKALDMTHKAADVVEALTSPGHADASCPNALPPKRKIEISSPDQGGLARAASVRTAVSGRNEGRTLLSIEEAQAERRTRAGWEKANFVQDRDGAERQRIKTSRELATGLMKGKVAFVTGDKYDFLSDAGSSFFKGTPRIAKPSSRPPVPKPTTTLPAASQSAQRTLPMVPVNHSAVDAKKPAPQTKVRKQRVESTWGALIDASMKDPGQSSPEMSSNASSEHEAPLPESSAAAEARARRRRVTVINSQAFDPANSAGVRDSIAMFEQPITDSASADDSDDEDEPFNFPDEPSNKRAQRSTKLDAEAQRLERIDIGERFAPFDKEEDQTMPLQIDTHIRGNHVSWYARDSIKTEHSRQHRVDVQSPREGDEASRLWERLEEEQRTGMSPQRSRRR